MINTFRQWYIRNQVEITWFIIGWLGLATVVDFGRENWLGVLLDLGLIWVNYIFRNR